MIYIDRRPERRDWVEYQILSDNIYYPIKGTIGVVNSGSHIFWPAYSVANSGGTPLLSGWNCPQISLRVVDKEDVCQMCGSKYDSYCDEIICEYYNWLIMQLSVEEIIQRGIFNAGHNAVKHAEFIKMEKIRGSKYEGTIF